MYTHSFSCIYLKPNLHTQIHTNTGKLILIHAHKHIKIERLEGKREMEGDLK